MEEAGNSQLYHRKKNRITKNTPVTYSGVPTDEDRYREEKPWQRVYDGVTKRGEHIKEPVRSVPSTLLIAVLGVYLLFGYFTQLIEDDMPSVVREADISRDNTDTFSEETALRYLHTIIGEEPRVAGTQYHLQKTLDLQELLRGIAAQAAQTVQVKHTVLPWNHYWIAWGAERHPHLNLYQGVSNVVARLDGDGSTNTSVLINCHYDSVPFALGASDNAVFCAIMAEALSKLSRRTRRLKNNLIFLFNGAEENPLQGSHAFLSDPWASGITTVVNLDAAGMNGKANVFQVTDPRVLSAYRRRTGRPNGQSVGEFLFTSGIVPSDTDFRIWRDFGGYHGIDIAFVKWASVYHTRYDHPDLLQPGVLQAAGDMLLALLGELGELEELAETVTAEKAVYYDFLNTVMIVYSPAVSVVVDLTVTLASLASVAYYLWIVGFTRSSALELLLYSGSRVVSALSGFLVVLLLTLIVSNIINQLRYLSHPWIVVPLYWLPYTLVSIAASQLIDAWRVSKRKSNQFKSHRIENRLIRALLAMSSTRLVLSIALLVMTCAPALSGVRYVLTVPLLLMTVSALVSMTVLRFQQLKAYHLLAMELVFSLPAFMFTISLAIRVNAIILPTMGRNAADTPDITVAMVNLGLAILAGATMSGIELLFSRRWLWTVLCGLGVACLVVMLIPMSPYQDDGPATQRHYWFHTEIVSHDVSGAVTSRSAGVLVTRHDKYTVTTAQQVLADNEIGLTMRTDFTEDCDRYVYCNLPLYRTVFGRFLPQSLFLYTSPPTPFSPVPTFTQNSRSCATSGQQITCTLAFTMIGAPHNMITFHPRPEVNVTSLSMMGRLSDLAPSHTHHDRPVYVVVHSVATYNQTVAPVTFSLEITAPSSLASSPVVDVSHHAHHIHHPEDFTAEYVNLMAKMPKYFNIATIITFRNNYIF